ncbi:MAG: hypothetical protein KKC46_17650 [Proteobacteria bacterium]|nr:hypothetical protein [Pseudomonadota bacterium]
MKRFLTICGALFLSSCLFYSCASTDPLPLKYLALERPEGKITTPEHRNLAKEFPRGGWYFGNYNFRPAPEIDVYLQQAQQQGSGEILTDADIRFNIPFAFDIFFFGYNKGTDILKAN